MSLIELFGEDKLSLPLHKSVDSNYESRNWPWLLVNGTPGYRYRESFWKLQRFFTVNNAKYSSELIVHIKDFFL